jgi:hypothetical protein
MVFFGGPPAGTILAITVTFLHYDLDSATRAVELS